MLVAQSCQTLCDPVDCSPPAPLSMEFSKQEYWRGLVAISFSRGSSRPWDQTQVSFTAGRCFTIWATREAPNKTITAIKFNKIAKYKINTQKSVIFYVPTANSQKKNFKNSFIIVPKRINYLGVNLTKEIKDVYSENYKH